MTYATASLVQAELRATTAFSESTNPSLATVTEWIGQTDDYIDSVTGQSWSSTNYVEYFDYEGVPELYPRHTPIVVINSLSYNTVADGEAPIYASKTENTDYVVDDIGRIRINLNKWSPVVGRKKGIKLDYDAGYSTVPARVQMLATKLVTERVLSSLLSSNVEERNAGGSISVGSINIVEPGDYGVGTYKQLKSDIKDLQEQVTNSGFRVHRYG